MTVKNIAEEYVTAIDLGSSKIVGLLAKRIHGKGVEIVAEHIVNSGNCMKRGAIYNFSEAAALIKQVIASLELKSGENLKKINVNISGQSLRSRFNDEIEFHLDNESVSEEDIQSIEEEIQEQVVADYEIICNTKPSFFGNSLSSGCHLGRRPDICQTLQFLEYLPQGLVAMPIPTGQGQDSRTACNSGRA